MRYSIALLGWDWQVFVRYPSGGFKMNHFHRLQDAYAWLFNLGAFDRRGGG